MLENLFIGLFDTDLVAVISVTDFLLCLGCTLVLGLVMAFTYMYRTRYTKSFVVTLALLPAVVCVVIMLVNGNVGTGVAVAVKTETKPNPITLAVSWAVVMVVADPGKWVLTIPKAPQQKKTAPE